MRRAAKIDQNQRAIVNALRKIPGVSVEVGHDDFLCGYRGLVFWFECKDESARSAKTGEILGSAKTPRQKRLDETWTGHRAYVVTLDDVLRELGIYSEEQK